MKYLNVTVEVFCFLGRVGRSKPGVAGAASEYPLERVVSNGVRTRGQPHKASIATDRLRAGMIEPSSWDFSPTLPPFIHKKGLHRCSPLKCFDTLVNDCFGAICSSQ